MGKHGPPHERFKRFYRVDSSGCWIWLGGLTSKGYAQFFDGKQSVRANRFIYKQVKGPIPDELELRHTCDEPLCVNPDHLIVGTHAENMADMVQRGRSPRMPGSKHHQAILSERDVEHIRSLVDYSHAEIARAFGVSRSTICNIRKRKSWKHL